MYDMPFDNYQGEFIFLNEGDKIFLGEDELEIIHTPGHSPGSICFYCKAQNFIIGGDVLFNGSIGRTDIPMADHQTIISSIKQKIIVLGDRVFKFKRAESNLRSLYFCSNEARHIAKLPVVRSFVVTLF